MTDLNKIIKNIPNIIRLKKKSIKMVNIERHLDDFKKN